jgi:endoglucanase
MTLRIWRPVTVFAVVTLVLVFFFHSKEKDKPEFVTPVLPAFRPHLRLNTTAYHAPLHTQGRDIVDSRNKVVKLASVNWYGGSDELFVPGGLDIQHRNDIALTISEMGFNSVRLPYSDEMVVTNPLVPYELVSANPDLAGLNALGIYKAVVDSLTDAGIFVIPNNHITQATWCCGINPCDASWRNDYLGPVCRVWQSEEQWIRNWLTVMSPFSGNPLVIGADLRNEPRGLWGTIGWDSWAAAAEKAGNKLLELNPDWLIFVEGTSSSNDLAGVTRRPVVLDVSGRVVYSSHVYSWSGWGSLGGTYAKRTYESFAQSMQENWAYLLEFNVAPVWVGEFGAPHLVGMDDKNYWDNLMRFLRLMDADFAYWAINPRKPHDYEEESYSLLEDDWQTPIWDYRMKDIVELIQKQRIS